MAETVESVHQTLRFVEQVEAAASTSAKAAPDAPDVQTNAAMKKEAKRASMTAGQRADGHHKELLESHAKHLVTIVEEKNRAVSERCICHTSLETVTKALAEANTRIAELTQAERTAKQSGLQSTGFMAIGSVLLSVAPQCTPATTIAGLTCAGVALTIAGVIGSVVNVSIGWPKR